MRFSHEVCNEICGSCKVSHTVMGSSSPPSISSGSGGVSVSVYGCMIMEDVFHGAMDLCGGGGVRDM